MEAELVDLQIGSGAGVEQSVSRYDPAFERHNSGSPCTKEQRQAHALGASPQSLAHFCAYFNLLVDEEQ